MRRTCTWLHSRAHSLFFPLPPSHQIGVPECDDVGVREVVTIEHMQHALPHGLSLAAVFAKVVHLRDARTHAHAYRDASKACTPGGRQDARGGAARRRRDARGASLSYTGQPRHTTPTTRSTEILCGRCEARSSRTMSVLSVLPSLTNVKSTPVFCACSAHSQPCASPRVRAWRLQAATSRGCQISDRGSGSRAGGRAKQGAHLVRRKL